MAYFNTIASKKDQPSKRSNSKSDQNSIDQELTLIKFIKALVISLSDHQLNIRVFQKLINTFSCEGVSVRKGVSGHHVYHQ